MRQTTDNTVDRYLGFATFHLLNAYAGHRWTTHLQVDQYDENRVNDKRHDKSDQYLER